MKYVLFYLVCCIVVLIACGTLLDFDRATAPPKTASVCDYKVAFIYRATFRPGEEGEKDFYRSVTAQIEWLGNHNNEVLSMTMEYGHDMTRKLVVKSACIKYKEIKNGMDEKEKGD